MNTRLQVEHPVTEMVTGSGPREGTDSGWRAARPSPSLQSDLRIHGHAVELCASMPKTRRRTSCPTSVGWRRSIASPKGPRCTRGRRLRGGHGHPHSLRPDDRQAGRLGSRRRSEAIARMKRAIAEYRIVGVRNTLSFGRFVMDHPAFVARRLHDPLRERALRPRRSGTGPPMRMPRPWPPSWLPRCSQRTGRHPVPLNRQGPVTGSATEVSSNGEMNPPLVITLAWYTKTLKAYFTPDELRELTRVVGCPRALGGWQRIWAWIAAAMALVALWPATLARLGRSSHP